MFSTLYDRKYLFKCLFSMAFVFGLMKVTNGSGYLVVIPLTLGALISRRTESLFFWLLISVCAIIVNGYVIPKNAVFAWSQRGLMLGLGVCMALSVLAYPKHAVLKPYLGILFYIGFMALSSAQGWCPIISYLKLLLFTVIFFSYFGVANQVGVNPMVSSKRVRSVMLAVSIFFVLGSIAVIPFPALSQLKHDEFVNSPFTLSLFTGITNHSQCLGPVVSSISVVVFADLLFSIKKWDPLYLFLLLCCPYLVYKTSSRTGMGAYLLGMMFVAYLFMNARGVGSSWKSRAMTSIMIILVGLVVVVSCMPGFQKSARKFLLKTSDASSAVNTDVVISSRQGLIDRSMYYFKKKPLMGNGFQVSEKMERLKIRDIKSILSAPIEKGVWVSAVLEEGGVIGWLLFVGFLVGCITTSIKRRAYTGASCLFVCTLTNLGEFTFFSMSYTGGFVWAMVFVGLALDIRKMKDENDEIMREMMRREMEMAQRNPRW